MEDEIQPWQVAIAQGFVDAADFQGERMIGVIVYKMVDVYRDAGCERDQGALE